MRKLLVPILALLCLVCTKAAPESKTAQDLVPASNAITGWTRDGSLDTAATAAELTALLGSLAQPYVDNGFAGFCRQHFAGMLAGSPVELELRVADMKDTTHAKAVYAALATTGQTPWTVDNPGAEARIRQESLTCAIDFRTSNFYVWLSIDTGSIASLDVARLFALEVAHLADSTAPPPVEPIDVVRLVPGDNEISGWTRSSAMQVAETGTQLEAIIDGEAVPYENNHFVKCAFQTYTGTVGSNVVSLNLRVFDMTDTTHAAAVYAAVATGVETPWTGDNAGTEARIDESLLFDYRIDLRDGKFYVSIDIADKSDAGLSIAKLFARNVSSAIRDAAE